MKKGWLLTCAIAAFVLQTPVFGQPVIEIRAVKVNDVAVTPSTVVPVNPGDTVEAELILLPGFGTDLPEGVRIYQVGIDGRLGATSGGNDRVLPLSWDAPLDGLPCEEPADCPFEFSSCVLTKCVGDSHFPASGAFVDKTRSDYIFSFAKTVQTFVATPTLRYVLGSLNDEQIGRIDDGTSEFYLGTYTLVVGEFACGTFTFPGSIAFGVGTSVLAGPAVGSPDVVATVVGLELDTGACGPLPTDSSNCSLDARYPHPPNRTTPLFAGDTFALQFDVSPGNISAGNFVVSTVPPTLLDPPSIDTIGVVGTRATVTMVDEFADDRWTCIRHLATNRTFCRANLPGDSDQNQFVETADIEALLHNLRPPELAEGEEPLAPLAMSACDIDRSQECLPLDLLGSINLLIGSGTFAPGFEGAELRNACPGAPRP